MFVKYEEKTINMEKVAWYRQSGSSVDFYFDAHTKISCYMKSSKDAKAFKELIDDALDTGIEDLITYESGETAAEKEQERKATEKLDKDLTKILDDLFSNLDKDIQDICRKHGLDKK